MPDEPKLKDGYEWRTCPKCKGSGKQKDIIYHGPDQTCDRCKGLGKEQQCIDGSDFVGGA